MSASSFADYYGTVFTIVIDVNRNGIFDAGDITDASDTTALDDYFSHATFLGPGSTNAAAATTNYQNILLTKLNAPGYQVTPGAFDATTQYLSSIGYCQPGLGQADYNSTVLPEAQGGFIVIGDSYYEPNKTKNRFSSFSMTDTGYDEAVDESCISTEEEFVTNNVTYTGKLNVTAGGPVTISGTQMIHGGGVTINTKPIPTPASGIPPVRLHMDPGSEIKTDASVMGVIIAVLIGIGSVL